MNTNEDERMLLKIALMLLGIIMCLIAGYSLIMSAAS